MKRNRGYHRYQRKRNINRKYTIRINLWGLREVEAYYSKYSKGMLSKGKIHCSCWMCREKTYDSLSPKDKKSKEYADSQIKEYLY